MRQVPGTPRPSPLARTLMVAAGIATLLGTRAHAQSSADSIVAPESGVAMCKALKPPDFARVGLTASDAQGSTDSGDPGSVYCTYPSPAGKIELDLFYESNWTPVQAIQVERTALGSVGAQFKPVQLDGADDPQMGAGGSGAKAFTSIVFRRGTAVVSLGIPSSPKASDQLLALARVVIGRIHRK